MIIPRSIKTTGNFKIGQNFYIFEIIYDPLIFIIDFSKFDPLTAAGMALCVNLGPKCQNLFS